MLPLYVIASIYVNGCIFMKNANLSITLNDEWSFSQHIFVGFDIWRYQKIAGKTFQDKAQIKVLNINKRVLHIFSSLVLIKTYDSEDWTCSIVNCSYNKKYFTIKSTGARPGGYKYATINEWSPWLVRHLSILGIVMFILCIGSFWLLHGNWQWLGRTLDSILSDICHWLARSSLYVWGEQGR